MVPIGVLVDDMVSVILPDVLPEGAIVEDVFSVS